MIPVPFSFAQSEFKHSACGTYRLNSEPRILNLFKAAGGREAGVIPSFEAQYWSCETSTATVAC